MNDSFFGYGSLVNRQTHDHDVLRPAQLRGWRRTWRHTAGHEVAYLTAIPDPSAEIDGLVARVLGGDWSALDAREAGYDRVPAEDVAAQVYWIPHDKHASAPELRPILLSYLDVVVQGYLQEFGEAGVARFFATTSGWEAPIADDRAKPRYPRAQNLTREETALVDRHLKELGAC